MKTVVRVHYLGGKEITVSCPASVEVADHIYEVLQLRSQRLANSEFDILLPKLDYEYVIVLIEPSLDLFDGETVSDVYIVPIEVSTDAGIFKGLNGNSPFAAKEVIGGIVNQVFGVDTVDVKSLQQVYGDSSQCSGESTGISRGSVFVASCPSSHPPPIQVAEAADSPSPALSATPGVLESQLVQGSPEQAQDHGEGEADLDDRFSLSDEEKSDTSSKQQRFALEVEQKEAQRAVFINQEIGSGREQGVMQRDAFPSISFDLSPAFLSTSDDLQDFLKQVDHDHNDDDHSQKDISVSFDLIPAFHSKSEEVCEDDVPEMHGPPVDEGLDTSSNDDHKVAHDDSDEIPPAVEDTSSAASIVEESERAPSHRSLPGGKNPMVFYVPCRPKMAGDLKYLVHPQPNNVVCQRSDGSCHYVYPTWDPSCYLLPDAKTEGFLREECVTVADRTMLYARREFTQNSHLLRGSDCRVVFPSPATILRLVKKLPRFAEERKDILGWDVKECGQNNVPKSKLLGKGGNGIAFAHVLMNHHYAVKLAKYNERELDIWCQLDHLNVLSLHAVVWVVPGCCYQVMPKMTGNLKSLMCLESISDLSKLALSQDNDDVIWDDVIKPNIRHILAGILHGLAYLNSKGLQHCDLKESNILIDKTCDCPDILHCVCDVNDKCRVAISDFDSIKRFSTPNERSKAHSKGCGTPYYRPPEMVNNGVIGHKGDIYSFGMIICQLCHSVSEIKELIAKCEKLAVDYPPMPDSDSLPMKEHFYSNQMLISLQDKSLNAPLSSVGDVMESRLMPLARMAKKSLEHDPFDRPTVSELLEYPFFS